MNKRIRVLVVDDSAFMRKVISDIINSDPGLEVIEKARNGEDALEKIIKLNPDVVTMDIEMPKMDGITALRKIMDIKPSPVIMLSSLTKKGADQTIQALQLGAVDFIAKPSGEISLDIEKIKEEIIAKIKIAAQAQSKIAITNAKRPFVQNSKKSNSKKSKNKDKNNALLKNLVIIGVSTGGPKALHQVITNFPPDMDAAVLVVQHMPPKFTRSLAERLNDASAIRVKEAENGEVVESSCVYIAPGDFHLHVKPYLVQGLTIKLNSSLPRGGHRPSVNEMFESVAQNYDGKIIAVIMTGMGNDGTEGIKLVKRNGGIIIAEDQSTCTVYGMPKAAVESGLVDRIVPLYDISKAIMSLI